MYVHIIIIIIKLIIIIIVIIIIIIIIIIKLIIIIIGASLSEPHTYRTAVQNLPYIYTHVLPGRHPIWPHEGPLKRQRANVGPTSQSLKVNNIALKTATLVLRFS